MSIKAVKKLRKLKDELDKVHEKEDDLLFKIDEAIDELEDPHEDQDVESRYSNVYSFTRTDFCAFLFFVFERLLEGSFGVGVTFRIGA